MNRFKPKINPYDEKTQHYFKKNLKNKLKLILKDEDEDEGDDDNLIELIHTEANNLIDSILEQSLTYINSQNQSEISENFAIKSEISNGYDLIVKSPTIESMSGKSFDDNLSNSDEILINSNNDNNNGEVCGNFGLTGVLNNITLNSTTATATATDTASSIDNNTINAVNDNKMKRIEKKFERITSQLDDKDLDENDNEFNLAFSNINKDDVSILQNDFSKISWDESQSANTTGDFGSSTPDNDLQEFLINQGGFYFSLSN